MKKLSLLLSLFLIIPSITLGAQTQTLEYDYIATTPAVVATYTQQIKVNTSAFTTFTPTCVAVNANTHCTFALPAPGVKSGDVITVAAVLGNNTATGTLTYNPGTTPTTPSNIKIIVIFSVP